ncbi:MAG: hypothetical protein R8G33_02390 [Gammaproteobacteria bacterium]|nr:hypothetical protein [Gammaproteobacteria bacterium]
MKKSTLLNPLIWLFVSLTLGLAPFTPEPHIWEKIKWVYAGANGMQPIDWFDLVLHGTPWVMLVLSVIYRIKK